MALRGGPKDPGSGRKKGTPNKRTLEVQELIDRTGCTDPLANLKCNVCRGKLKTKYKRDDGRLGERICESCYGSGYEIVSPELRGKMWAKWHSITGQSGRRSGTG